jgi:hypothetical protein
VTATTSIRTRVRDELIARLNAHPALVGTDGQRVPVSPGLPGKNIEREHVFVVQITGQRQVRFLEAGRKTIDDEFTITWVFMTAQPGAETLEADDRVEQMGGALEDVLADDPGLSDAQGEPMDGLLWAVSARWDGPDHELTDEGAAGFLRADVDCKARYL